MLSLPGLASRGLLELFETRMLIKSWSSEISKAFLGLWEFLKEMSSSDRYVGSCLLIASVARSSWDSRIRRFREVRTPEVWALWYMAVLALEGPLTVSRSLHVWMNRS